jgi:hypothetical protein
MRPAGGETTLMGPAAPRSRGPQKRLSPMRVQVLKRTTGREVWEWPNDPADLN